MKVLSPILAIFMLLAGGQLFAQDMSKEESKKWKSAAKEYKRNPASLKSMTEELDQYRAQVGQVQGAMTGLEAEKAQLTNQVTQLEQENRDLSANLLTAQESIRQLSEQQAALAEKAPAEDEMMMGTIFRVQIGAYKKNPVPETVAVADNMAMEEEDGYQKVLVGQFTDFEEAKKLMEYLKKTGVRGAWVVPYMDGRRVSLKEALGTGGR